MVQIQALNEDSGNQVIYFPGCYYLICGDSDVEVNILCKRALT